MSQRQPPGAASEGSKRHLVHLVHVLRDHSIAGVIGGAAFAAVIWVWANGRGWLGDYGDRANVITLVGGLLVGLALGWWRQASRQKARLSARSAALDDADRLLKLDETLFRHLLVLAEGDGDEQSIRGVIYEVLQNLVAFFGDDVVRGTVLRPSDDALCAWVGYLMPQESLDRLRFPFNPPSGAPVGVALQAYRTRKIQFERMKKLKDGRWKASSSNYVIHDTKRSRPPYSVFVAIPLSFESNVMGVLCLDSTNVDTFVKGRDEEKLIAIALRVSAPLAVFGSLTARD